MASRMSYSTTPRTTRSRTKDAETEKSSSLSKRSSSIPTPSFKPSSTTSSLKSTTRKPTKAEGSNMKPSGHSSKQISRPAERRFPLYTAPVTSDKQTKHIPAPSEPIDLRRVRRKPSISDQRSAYAQTVDSQDYHGGSEGSYQAHKDPYPSAVLGVSLPPTTATLPAHAPSVTAGLRMQSFMSHGRQPPEPVATPDLQPPTPVFARSQSASTGFSESPSGFSNYSRESTPTSISSSSPAISQIPKFANRRASSPTRAHPPITRRKVGEPSNPSKSSPVAALSAVRETSNPGSSALSAKGLEPPVENKPVVKKKVLRKQPPNPPQRKSSKSALVAASIDLAISTKAPTLPVKVAPSPTREPTIPVLTSPTATKIPPSRPSRDGIPELRGFGRAPIVQSNLPHGKPAPSQNSSVPKTLTYAEQHNERVTLDRSSPPEPEILHAAKQSMTRVTGLRQPSVTSPHLISRESSSTRQPSKVAVPATSRQSSRDPSPVITSPSKSLSRFGLFSKKPKNSVETVVSPSGDKSARKGPAAGTGHEGYGRYGRRGRSSSTSTAASRARSTSIESNAASVTRPSGSRKSSFNSQDDRSDLDDFLKDRLEPVIIGGGGKIRENRNSGIGISIPSSNQSSTLSLDSTVPTRVLYRQNPSSNVSMADSVESVAPRSVASGTSSPSRPSLAHRRSLHRAQLSGDLSDVKVLAPIKTQRIIASPALGTYDSTISTAPPTDASGHLTDVSEGREGNWLRPKKKTLTKPRIPRKWNIFHRGHRSTDSIDQPALSRQSSNDQKALGIYGADLDPPVAHYALSDEFDSDNLENIEQRLENIEAHLDDDAGDDESELELVKPREMSVLLPSPPKFPDSFESFSVLDSTTQAPRDLSNTALNRPPRLQQIGRIPRLPSKLPYGREQRHKPSPQSFSRPFARSASVENDTDSELIPRPVMTEAKPKLGLQTKALPGLSKTESFIFPASAPPTNSMLHNLEGEQEFLHFSPRKWSEVSTANSSGTMSLAAITAMISHPDAILSDDEVWGEFDEFLDHVTSPLTMSPNTPGRLASIDYFAPQTNVQTSKDGSVTSIEDGESDDDRTDRTARPKLDLLSPPSQLTPLNSPVSLTDLYNGYGARSSTAKSAQRESSLSTISGSVYSTQTPISQSESQSSVPSSQANKRVTQVMAEKTRCSSTDSLRFSALMTSRWLSFDRVLFSPVQEKIRSTRQDRILVVDGLGNDDWSTYCALTYPEATVHSLSSMSGRSRNDQQNPDNWTSPTNHRRHTYTDITAPFPFVKNWFSAVVFRFPAANTSFAYRHAITECKRVLRPGGYLELSILDMDLVNMGSKTNHAIRSLKLYLHESRPDISLSPVSDDILKLLGKKGFENVSRALVSVPVVGSGDESPTKPTELRFPLTPETATRSLGDMLVDQAQGQTVHYPSTHAMAKAARWWWSKCYEHIARRSNITLWEDEELLQECENRETGLKLFVCYAQKPLNLPRRTASV